MHRGIVANPALDAASLDLLHGITFAFICVDAGEPSVSLSSAWRRWMSRTSMLEWVSIS
jgi:hypothetical protein